MTFCSPGPKVYYFLVFLVIVALILLPFIIDDSYYLRLITTVFLFAALGQAWNLIGGLGNQASLGHAAFFGIGAYSSAILYRDFGIVPWFGMIVGAVLSCLLALLISVPTFRLRGPYFALGTLAVGEIAHLVALQWRDLTGGSVGISIRYTGDSWWTLQFRDAMPYYYLFLSALGVVTGIFVIVKRSKLGYYLLAVRHDEAAAQSVGVNVFKSKLLASLASAAITSVLGTLYAQHLFFVDPASVFGLIAISVTMALVAIVGGLGYAAGPIIGSAIFFFIQEIGSTYGGGRIGVAELITGLVLLFVILASPRGLMGLSSHIRTSLASRNRKGVPMKGVNHV